MDSSLHRTLRHLSSTGRGLALMLGLEQTQLPLEVRAKVMSLSTLSAAQLLDKTAAA